jgi:hypothetical protein
MSDHELRRRIRELERDADERGDGSGWLLLMFLLVLYGCETRQKLDAMNNAGNETAAEVQAQEEDR